METMDPAAPPDREALPQVLLVGYPTALAAAAAMVLKAAGMEVEIAATEPEAAYMLERFRPGVVLLHAEGAAAAWIGHISAYLHSTEAAVIVVLAEDGEAPRVAALDAGADDVVPADVPPRELVARLRALHRRTTRGTSSLAPTISPEVGIDTAHRCLVGRMGERSPLSEAEFIALETLLDADGAPVSREWLGRLALKRLPHPEDRSVDQLVLKLRRKLVAVGASERTILSARRQGYVIADPTRFRSLLAAPADVERERLTAGAGR